jgi:hypothetical protein
MTDAQAPQVPPPANGHRQHEPTTTLTGDFHFDLRLNDAATACNKAMKGLGWPIKVVGANHVASYADTTSAQHPPKIEVELHGEGQTTDVRITGTNSDAGPHDALIVELDRVRDAITVEAEAIENSAQDPPADSSDVETESPPAEQMPPPAMPPMPPPAMPPMPVNVHRQSAPVAERARMPPMPVNGHRQSAPVAEPARVEPPPPLPPQDQRAKFNWKNPFVIIALIVAFCIGGAAIGLAVNGNGGTHKEGPGTQLPTVTPSDPGPSTPSVTPSDRGPSTPKEKPTPEKAEPTSGQENALRSAQDYLDYTAFSKAGLIGQLSSSAGEGFSKADATYAANHVDVDWNAEAVEAAQDYLDYSAFSKSGLIQQLSSSAGDQFTPAQAQYAADKVY